MHRLGFGVQELDRAGHRAVTAHGVPGAVSLLVVEQAEKLYERLPRQPGRSVPAASSPRGSPTTRRRMGAGAGSSRLLLADRPQPPGDGPGHPGHAARAALRDRFADPPTPRLAAPGLHVAGAGIAWAARVSGAAGSAPRPPRRPAPRRWHRRRRTDRARGDWQVERPLRECGGWAFEFDNDPHRTLTDTAIVVLALLEGGEGARRRTQPGRWAEAMRSSNGAWGSFDKDNTRQLATASPSPTSEPCSTRPARTSLSAHWRCSAGLGRRPATRWSGAGSATWPASSVPGGSW